MSYAHIYVTKDVVQAIRTLTTAETENPKIRYRSKQSPIKSLGNLRMFSNMLWAPQKNT